MAPSKPCPCSKCKGKALWPTQTVKRHIQEEEKHKRLELLRKQAQANRSTHDSFWGTPPSGFSKVEVPRLLSSRPNASAAATLPTPERHDSTMRIAECEDYELALSPEATQAEKDGVYDADFDADFRLSTPEAEGAAPGNGGSPALCISDKDLLEALATGSLSTTASLRALRAPEHDNTSESPGDNLDPGFPLAPHSTEEDSTGDEIDNIDMESDPLYRSREDIFNSPSSNLAQEFNGESVLPPAFTEDPLLRNIYIRVFVQAAYKGASHDAVHSMLCNERLTLLALQDQGLLPDLDLSKFPTTLATVERRLGVCPDDQIIYYFICPVCWDRHDPKELYELGSPDCTREGCGGILYSTNGVRDSRNRLKRTPQKLLPYASLVGYVQRLLLRPGKAEEIEHWRREDDMGPQPPLTREEWLQQTPRDKRLQDIHDGAAWRSIETDIRRVLDVRSFTARMESTRPTRSQVQFVSRPLSLLFTMNVDWMQPVKSRIHSTGAVYMTINNLPRHLRSLRENTFLLCVIPGPAEPSLEQMNVVTELVVDEVSKLANGIDVSVLRHIRDPETAAVSPSIHEETVHGEILNNCSDTPARAKSSGLASVSSEQHMCAVCWSNLSSLSSVKCFDPTEFNLRDPSAMMFWKLYAESADQEGRDIISEARGVRFSPLDKRPSWQGALSSPGEPMHMILLGCAATVHKTLLVGGGMFVGSRKKGARQPTVLYEEFLSSVWWPSFVSRVPPKELNRSNGKVKADQWRHLLAVYPVALFVAWRNDLDEIPDADAPKAAKSQKNTEKSVKRSNNIVQRRKKQQLAFAAAEGEDIDSSDLEEAENSTAERNYKKHFFAVLNFVAAVRIILTWTITLGEADRAERLFSLAFQTWAAMGCHLTPNFHAVLHIRLWIELFGPVYGWWVYAFERMNGVLAKFKTNGRGGGELEATLLRGWLKLMMLQDLASHMQGIPNPTRDDTATTETLLTAMKGGGEGQVAKGSFLTYLAAITPVMHPDGIKLPVQSKVLDLHKEQLYAVVLHFAQCTINPAICSYGDRIVAGKNALHSKFKSYSTVHVSGRKYGAYKTPRGKSLGFAYIKGRQAARIDHIFTLEAPKPVNGRVQVHTEHCAIVRKWRQVGTEIEPPPWERHATDLGIDMWYNDDNDLLPPEVVRLTELESHFAWAPLQYLAEDLHVTFSLDHQSQEPEREEE